MRVFRLGAICLLATAAVVAQGAKSTPLPAGCQYSAYHAYSECQADGFWHVVSDGLWACNGQAGRTRLTDKKTDQACTGQKKTKAPEAQTQLATGLQGCQSPKPDGDIWVQQCISNIWHNVKYLRYVCLDGAVRLDAPKYYSTGQPCGDDQPPPDLDVANPGTATAAPVSLASPAIDLVAPDLWSPSEPGARDTSTQLMMIDLLDISIPGTRVASAEPLLSPARTGQRLADAWRTLTHAATPSLSRGLSDALWIDPGAAAVLQGVTRSARVHAYLTSLGTSTGQAFDVTIVNDGREPVRLTGDGVVVEPIKKGADKSDRAGLQKALATRGASMTTSKANAYCLEFKLSPPDQGSMFHVVDAATQGKYGAARDILHASRQLQAANQLQPDSDPLDYFHAIRQWAIWVDEQHYTTRAQYAQAFVERTKKNVVAVKQQWTKQMEETLNQLVPHRWDEIVKILRAAGHPVPGA
jgi:hypothetical protein